MEITSQMNLVVLIQGLDICYFISMIDMIFIVTNSNEDFFQKQWVFTLCK